jgi:hypothetical protein
VICHSHVDLSNIPKQRKQIKTPACLQDIKFSSRLYHFFIDRYTNSQQGFSQILPLILLMIFALSTFLIVWQVQRQRTVGELRQFASGGPYQPPAGPTRSANLCNTECQGSFGPACFNDCTAGRNFGVTPPPVVPTRSANLCNSECQGSVGTACFNNCTAGRNFGVTPPPQPTKTTAICSQVCAGDPSDESCRACMRNPPSVIPTRPPVVPTVNQLALNTCVTNCHGSVACITGCDNAFTPPKVTKSPLA